MVFPCWGCGCCFFSIKKKIIKLSRFLASSPTSLFVSDRGVDFIASHEGLRLSPYLDPVGIWTVGYGHVLYDKISGKRLEGLQLASVVKQQYSEFFNMSKEIALMLFRSDLKKFEDIVKSKVFVRLSQNQFDALVSHTFNTGGSMTLFNLINRGASSSEIRAFWITKYVTAKGVRLKGLEKRRLAEANLFFS